MKLFCRCIEPWIIAQSNMKEHDETRLVKSNYECFCKCKTYYYWYNTDYENMMFDLKSMNS